MANRTIQVNFWHYRDAAGKRRIAWLGDEVDLSDDEIARGDKAGVFTAPTPTVRTPDPLEVVLAGGDPNAPDPADPPAADPPADPPADPAADDSTAPAADPRADAPAADVSKRPAKAAAVEVWRAFIVTATAGTDSPVTAEQAEGMTKDQLQAAAPPEG